MMQNLHALESYKRCARVVIARHFSAGYTETRDILLLNWLVSFTVSP